jgi:glycosyltransferase involved in cell wall biosynthesis
MAQALLEPRSGQVPSGGAPLRLLWLLDSLTLGGAERLVAPFARALDPARGSLQVACLKEIGGNRLAPEVAAAGVPPRNLEARNLRDLAAYRRLCAALTAQGTELVHAHLAYAILWGAAAAGRAGIPCVATLHVHPQRRPPWTREGARELLLGWSLRRRAATVVAVSAAVRQAWIATHRLDPRRVEVVPNGVDVGLFRSGDEEDRRRVRAALGLPPGCPLVLSVCVLRPGKRVDTLLEAAPAVLAAAPAARFVVVGDGPQRSALEERAAAAGLAERVRFTGRRDDVHRLLAGADLFVLTSGQEALPTVVLEAMACAVPVVATRAGGTPEAVRDDQEGCLVPVGDAPAFGRAVASLLGDPERRRAMGEAGRRRAEAAFSTRLWAARLLEVYHSALSRPRAHNQEAS